MPVSGSDNEGRLMSRIIVVACGVLAAVQAVQADQISIGAAKDNTLYEDELGQISNGAGQHFFAGKTGEFNGFVIRRGLIAFDIAGSVPEGSTITGVTMTLHLSMSAPGSGNQPVALYHVLADWGEGESDAPGTEGPGAQALPGDATWLHTFFDTDFWAQPGGDFLETASASTPVGMALGQFPTWSSSQMISDVQAWLDQPSTNFGWLVRCNEDDANTARRFDSCQNLDAKLQPTLQIDFEPASACPWDLDDDGMVGVSDLLELLGAWGTDPSGPPDFDGDNTVGLRDLLEMLANWGTCP